MAVIAAVSHFQISAQLSAPTSACSISNMKQGPFAAWDGVDMV